MNPRAGAGGGRRRWQREISDILEDLPRQRSALRNAMAAFGESFDFRAFKSSFETVDDLDAYNRAQVVERGISRVQGYLAELAIAGAKLAGLELPNGGGGGPAERAFTAVADAGAIERDLARRLRDAQGVRNGIEHAYAQLPAGRVHSAALEVSEIAPLFAERFATWIVPHLPGDV